MPIRVTGLNSQMDTDSIIQELVKAASTKKTKLEKAQTKLSWKQDAWKTLNTKIHSFFKKTLGNMKFSDQYNKKATTVSNPAIATIIAGDSAVKGTQSLGVNALAKEGYLTGGKLITKDGSKATVKTKLSDLGTGGTAADGASISITKNGKTTTAAFDENATIDDVLNSLNSAGVSASFDAANQRIFINSTKTGKDNDFGLTANNLAGLDSLANLGLLTKTESGDGTEAARWAAYKGAGDADTLLNLTAEISKEEDARAAAILADSKDRIAQIKLKKGEQDLLKAEFDKTTKGTLDDIAGSSYYQSVFTAAGITNLGDLDSLANLDTDKLGEAKTALEEEKKRLEALSTADMTPDEIIEHGEKLKGLNNSIDDLTAASNQGKAYQNRDKFIADNNTALAENASYINELNVDADGNYSIAMVTDADGNTTEAAKATVTAKLTSEVEKDLVEKVNTAAIMSSYDTTNTASHTAVRIAGTDAEIELNGAVFTSSTNSFNVNGLAITAKELTNGTNVSITTAEDTEGVFNAIKDFIKGYNSLINEMDSLYNAASSKGYDPLSSEDKEGMSEDEIKKWEEKIKDSLLRRDTTLSTVVSSMKSTMLSSFTVGGKSLTLADFGISTMGYFNAAENEKGAYHINGDPDDENVSSEANKLMSLIASDPDTVTSFFTQLTSKLYDELDKQMKSSEYRSVYHVYDDKKMQKEYDDYTKKIKTQEEKVKRLEDKYYKQFGAMETALAKLQGSQSAISSMLGG